MRRCALVLLGIAVFTSTGTTQSTIWPPILLARPSDPAAPAAAATVIAAKGLTVNAVTVDPLDNVYVAGTGNALDVPGLDRGFDATPDGGDAFIAKLDRNGAVVWATYLGGSDTLVPVTGSVSFRIPDQANAIAVDAAGQVYVAGLTSATNFPVAGGFQSSRLGNTDGFVAKLSADGRRLLYSSYVGASGDQMSARGIAVGAAGEVWLQAFSPNRRWLPTYDLSGGTGRVLVVRLNPSGALMWSTRVAVSGSTGLRDESGFAVDGAGRAHVAGASCRGISACDHVMLRLAPSGSQLQYTVSFPNRNADLHPSPVALLPNGRAAFSGVAYDGIPARNEFAPGAPCPIPAFGCADPFIAIVNDGGAFDTVSPLGLREIPTTLTADVYGRLTIGAATRQKDLPLMRPLIDHHVDGPVFVSRDRGLTFAVEGRLTMPAQPISDLTFNWARHTLYAAAVALFESADEVTSWRRLTPDVGFTSDPWYRIAVDRLRPSIRYGILEDDVYRQDEGAEWRLVSLSPPGTYRRTVVVSAHDSSVWIAGNAGVAVSRDGGATWSDRSRGLPNLGGSSSTVEHLDFDPQRAGVVYAMTQAGLYRTIDDGATWAELFGGASARAIAFDPITSDTMHVATLNAGMLKSTDGGRTWTRTLEGHRVTVVATDHLKRHIVYAGGLDPQGRPFFYLSVDHGATWHRAGAGLDMRAEPSRLIVDPRDSLNLYLGSSAMDTAPYLMRLQPGASDPRRYAVEFASYLGHGQVRSMAATLTGGVVAALTHAWPSAAANDSQIAVVRIAP